MPSGGTMLDQRVLQSFSNAEQEVLGRHFPGFRPRSAGTEFTIEPRSVRKLDLENGDLLAISGNGTVAVAAFDAGGRPRPSHLGLQGLVRLDAGRFHAQPLLGWIAANGGGADRAIQAVPVEGRGEPVILRSRDRVTAWLIRPAEREDLVSGTAHGVVSVTLQPASGRMVLPDPLGRVREEFTVPRGTARAYEVAKGEYIQVIDLEGQQCSDFQAIRVRGLDRDEELAIDSTATRSMVRRAYPGPGLFDKFYDASLAPLLQVIQDSCGRHDTFGMACTARGYEERGFPGHVNCSDNMSLALSPFGVAPRVAWPAVNFFWNTWIDPHHQIQTEESHSRAGDFVVMKALDDLVCTSTACPDDIDPINGWNPTDIHVRIYGADSVVRRAVAYRPKEDGPMSMSQTSAFHPRLEPLTNAFAPARDLWSPVSFPAPGTLGEYWACRTAVTVQDMSGLRKFDVIGPDAERLLQSAMTRDIARLPVWRGTYSLICDETGQVIDDGTLFRMAPQLFRWCCGSEESGRWLTRLAEKSGWQVRIHDLGGALPNLAVQGPMSRDLLHDIVFTQPHVPSLEQMRWFGATVARLHDREGAPFFLTRTGYTGELGYEIFCSASDAIAVWDALAEAGRAYGLVPMGSDALETMRIEAGFAAPGSEFAPGIDALEAGLGFAVDMDKSSFVGRAALERNGASMRRVLKGLLFECDDVPAHGSPVYDGERQVGVVTSATRSPTLERAIALARISVEHAADDTVLEAGQLDGRMKRLTGKVTSIPFVDPKRERARA